MAVPKIGPPFGEMVSTPIRAAGVEVLQINIGYRCNLECGHCHVQAGPQRPEVMTREVMEECLRVLRTNPVPTIDITGGSPELHPLFPWFVGECARLDRRLLVRSNGVLLLDEHYEPLIDLYVEGRVEVVLSLPHVDPQITDRQRGARVFQRVVDAIRMLNARGYGMEGTGLPLSLVHNPVGAYLPGSQKTLASSYRAALRERYGIHFTQLFAITNMPIGRYLEYLRRTGNYDDYMRALIKAFNPESLKGLMCRSMVSVGWDGRLYDCDFNQVLGLAIDHGLPDRISGFDGKRLAGREIVIGDHCYGCTAGSGSSCQGQVA
jgi:radical SAM/Cys-rich protein